MDKCKFSFFVLTGWSIEHLKFKQDGLVFLGIGMMADFLKYVGTTDCAS